MAVVTFTRRQVTDMLPEYLTRRQATFAAEAKRLGEENGLSERAITVLSPVPALRKGDLVERSIYAFRSPYPIKRPMVEKGWAEIVAAGFATETPAGWRVTDRAVALAEDVNRRLRAHVARLPFPVEPTKRASATLWPIAERVPASAGRAAIARRLGPGPDEPRSDISTLTRAAQVLWGFRDDCHIPAWEARGYEGPAFDVLSYVWPGRGDVAYTKLPALTSVERLAGALEMKQDRADVERNVTALVARGDLERDGDGVRITAQGQRTRDEVEDDTDRSFFAIWDLDDAKTARLGDDLRTIIDALPKAQGG